MRLFCGDVVNWRKLVRTLLMLPTWAEGIYNPKPDSRRQGLNAVKIYPLDSKRNLARPRQRNRALGWCPLVAPKLAALLQARRLGAPSDFRRRRALTTRARHTRSTIQRKQLVALAGKKRRRWIYDARARLDRATRTENSSSQPLRWHEALPGIYDQSRAVLRV